MYENACVQKESMEKCFKMHKKIPKKSCMKKDYTWNGTQKNYAKNYAWCKKKKKNYAWMNGKYEWKKYALGTNLKRTWKLERNYAIMLSSKIWQKKHGNMIKDLFQMHENLRALYVIGP